MKTPSRSLLITSAVLLAVAAAAWFFAPRAVSPLSSEATSVSDRAPSALSSPLTGEATAPSRTVASPSPVSPATGKAVAPAGAPTAVPPEIAVLKALKSSGEGRVVACAQVGNRMYTLRPNELGDCPRVYVQAGDKIQVAMVFRDGNPGDPVVVEPEDGGEILETAEAVKVARLDEDLRLAFGFQVSENHGTHRVVLRRGGESQVLDFWVGEPPTLAIR